MFSENLIKSKSTKDSSESPEEEMKDVKTSAFLNHKMFSLSRNTKDKQNILIRQQLSLNQIIEKEQPESQIYQYDCHGKLQYVQFKLSEITLKHRKLTMIQILDISDSIMYQQEKNQTEQLSMLNATISHELRNPLNSIKARNMEKNYIH